MRVDLIVKCIYCDWETKGENLERDKQGNLLVPSKCPNCKRTIIYQAM